MNSFVFSVFLHDDSETWSVSSADRKYIGTLEMWIWTRMPRVLLTAKRTDAWILDDMGNSKRLKSIVIGRIFRFFGHVIRVKNTGRSFVQRIAD